MSSDSLERKRRSEFDISDDSADEQPPAKIRRSENTSSFSTILSNTIKSFVNWITPTFIKNNYMVDLVRNSLTQPSSSPFKMAVGDDLKNNSVEEDDDEIAVIAVQNGISGGCSRSANERKHNSFVRSSRHSKAALYPLASTPYTGLSDLPTFSRARYLEHRQMNGSANREPVKDHKKRNEKSIAPITNPSSDMEILLEGKSLLKDKDVEIISEIPAPVKKTKLPRHAIKTRKSHYLEDLINKISPRPHLQYTALEVIRLREKEAYKQLLTKVVQQNLYHPVPKRESHISAIQVDLTEDDDKPSSSYHFKKEKVEQVTDFLKYYKPCRLLPCKAAESQLQNSVTKIDDVQVVAGSDLPKFKPRQKTTGSIFSQDWIEKFKSTVEIDKNKHLQLISQENEKLQRYKKRRDERLAEYERMLEEQRLRGVIVPADEEMEDVLPEITPEMENIIVRAFGPGDPNEQLSSLDRLTLTRNDVVTLAKLNWLNDQVINFYMALIVERSKLDNYPSVHAFNSFFYTSLKTRGSGNVLRWTRRIDIFSFDIIIVPLHLGMHWALIIVDNRSKQIKYYDSMGSSEEKCLRIIQDYLIVEMQDKKKISMEPNTYSLEIPKDIPKQMNGSDCGMFTLKYAEYISRDAPITFTQENMPYFRRRMVYELLSKQIL